MMVATEYGQIELAIKRPLVEVGDLIEGGLISDGSPTIHIKIRPQGKSHIFELYGKLLPSEKLLSDHSSIRVLNLTDLARAVDNDVVYGMELTKRIAELEKDNLALKKILYGTSRYDCS